MALGQRFDDAGDQSVDRVLVDPARDKDQIVVRVDTNNMAAAPDAL